MVYQCRFIPYTLNRLWDSADGIALGILGFRPSENGTIFMKVVLSGLIPHIVKNAPIKARVYMAARDLGRAWEIAGAVCYFTSNASAYTTGQILTVSGGFGLATPVYGDWANKSNRC